MKKWISVKDRLPEPPRENIVFESVSFIVTDGKHVGVCDYQWGNGCGYPWSTWSSYGDFPRETITHWMKLQEES